MCLYAIFFKEYYNIIFSFLIGILFILNQEITNVFLEKTSKTEKTSKSEKTDFSIYLFQICSFSKGISAVIGSIILFLMCGTKLVDKLKLYYIIYIISIFTNVISFLIIFMDNQSNFISEYTEFQENEKKKNL